MSLCCDKCGSALRWRCPDCGCESYTPTTRGISLGFWSTFALGFLGVEDWRTQLLIGKDLNRCNERALQCACCGEIFGVNKGLTVEQAFRCKACGQGHYVLVGGP